MLLSSKTYVRKFHKSLKKKHPRQFILDNTAGCKKTHPIFTIFFNLGLPQTQKWLYLEIYHLMPSNQNNFNIK